MEKPEYLQTCLLWVSFGNNYHIIPWQVLLNSSNFALYTYAHFHEDSMQEKTRLSLASKGQAYPLFLIFCIHILQWHNDRYSLQNEGEEFLKLSISCKETDVNSMSWFTWLRHWDQQTKQNKKKACKIEKKMLFHFEKYHYFNWPIHLFLHFHLLYFISL